MQKDFNKSLYFEETEIFSPSDPHESSYEQVVSDSKRAFKCLHPSCEKVTRYKSDMERHIIIHQKAKPYACKYPNCDRAFKRPDALKNHVQTHSASNVYYCDIPGCYAQFQKKPALHYHLRQHKNERFCCNFPGCQKSFRTSKHLKQHEKVIQYHEKLAKSSSQNSSHKDTEDLGCFFNHSETQNSCDDDEDFFSQPEKFLHTEMGGAACLKSDNVFNGTNGIQFSALQKSSELAFQDLISRLIKENQEMKETIARRMGSLKAEYRNNFDSITQETFNHQFNFKND